MWRWYLFKTMNNNNPKLIRLSNQLNQTYFLGGSEMINNTKNKIHCEVNIPTNTHSK